ncbi:MAG: hypothetical protein ACE5D6_05865 [Candidatus Zixiibacteriota bacterium]
MNKKNQETNGKIAEYREHINRSLSPVLHYDEVQEIAEVIIKVLDANDDTISEE